MVLDKWTSRANWITLFLHLVTWSIPIFWASYVILKIMPNTVLLGYNSWEPVVVPWNCALLKKQQVLLKKNAAVIRELIQSLLYEVAFLI